MARSDGRRPRLSDTEALVREGINSPGAKLPPFGGNLAYENSADCAAEKFRSGGRFSRDTGPDGPKRERVSDELD